eukprot:6053055-Pyramimonas_sp.AAC.1
MGRRKLAYGSLPCHRSAALPGSPSHVVGGLGCTSAHGPYVNRRSRVLLGEYLPVTGNILSPLT